MAQYFTDFEEYPIGSGLPSDWTTWIDANSSDFAVSDAVTPGEKYIVWQPSNDGRQAVTWDEIPSSTDVEILFNWEDGTSLGADARTAIRLDTSANTTSSNATLYMHGTRFSADEHRLFYYNNGSSNTFSSTLASQTDDIFYWSRILVSGNEHKMLTWEGDLADEPLDGNGDPDWILESTDNTITGSGPVGLGRFESGAVRYFQFGVGTNGDTAPTSEPAQAPAAPTNLTATEQ